MDDLSRYTGNSHKKKEESDPQETRKPRLDRIVTVPATVERPGVWARLRSLIVEDRPRDVASWVFAEVVVPSLKDLLYNVGTSSLERTLFSGSDSRGHHSVGRSTRGSRYVRPNTRSSRAMEPVHDTRPSIDDRDRATHNFNNLVFRNAGEVEAIADGLVDLIQGDYGVATVADLYNGAGITPDFTDYNYGWFDLGAIRVRKVPNGYVLDLPRPEQIDKD